MNRKRIGRGLLFAALIVMIQLSSIKTSDAALCIELLMPDLSSTGSIYYDPTVDADLHGINLTVTGIKGIDTSLHSGETLAISNGALNFETGSLTGKTGFSFVNVLSFASSGEITLKGGVSALGIPDNGTINSGSFTSATLLQLPLGPYQFDIFSATFAGELNNSIKQYFGIATDTPLANALNFSFISAAKDGGGFTSAHFTGGVLVVDPVPTPLPAPLLLMASGLLSLTCFGKSMKRSSSI